MTHSPFLAGEKVYFRPYQESDATLIHQWLNDPEVTYYMFTGQQPTTQKEVEKIMSENIKQGVRTKDILSFRDLMDQETSAPTNTIFMICDVTNDALIGLVGLYDVHATARKAEMRIIVGNKSYWGKGYGTEITELINFYGFDRLNLNRIYLGVTSENKGGVRAYEKAGYVYEGLLKEDIYRNSRYYDSVRMGILRKEYYETFYENHKKKFVEKK